LQDGSVGEGQVFWLPAGTAGAWLGEETAHCGALAGALQLEAPLHGWVDLLVGFALCGLGKGGDRRDIN